MKKYINPSQMLIAGGFFSIAVLLLGVNLMKNTLNNRTYLGDPDGSQILKPNNQLLSRTKRVEPFNGLTLKVQYIDSLIFIPSNTTKVEMTGDKVLTENVRFHQNLKTKHLTISSSSLFQVKPSENDSLKSENIWLKNGGLVVKIYYRNLYLININQHVKTIIHRGVFKSEKLSIYASANTAQFKVDAKHLQLHLEKPAFNSIETPGLNTNHQLTRRLNYPLRVLGKADLVEVIHNSVSVLDLTQLQCRHVHADYANADYSVLEVAPTQLFSYIIPREDTRHHSEMICKSKAQVTKARYITALSLVERFH